MADANISTGYPDGTFHPTANVTRQAMAAFMYRLDGVLQPPRWSAGCGPPGQGSRIACRQIGIVHHTQPQTGLCYVEGTRGVFAGPASNWSGR